MRTLRECQRKGERRCGGQTPFFEIARHDQPSQYLNTGCGRANPHSDLGIVGTLRPYQQHQDGLYTDNFTAGCYATMTPKGELIKIIERLGEKVLELEKNPFCMDATPLEGKSQIYGHLVVARHKEQQFRYIDDLSLRVSHLLTRVSTPFALTEFSHSFESRIFADMQSAPRKELNKEYRLPKEGTEILSLSKRSALAILD